MAESALGMQGVALERERGTPGALDLLRRLVREKPLGFIGGLIVLLFIVMAAGAPLIAPYGPEQLGAGARLAAPTIGHPFGTDNLGRDVFSRVVHGAQVSMTIGFGAVAMSVLISLAIGVISGFFGGWFDMLFQRVVDAFMAFPALVFLIAVGAIFANSQIPGLPVQGLFSTKVISLIIELGILFGVGNSRVVRSATISVSNSTYLEAARASGASNPRLILVHVVPNVLPPVITLATLGLGAIILVESALEFLGLGVPPDQVTWGKMLNTEARAFMLQAPWLAIFPGLALSMAVFGFNMLGDALRDLLDPRLRRA